MHDLASNEGADTAKCPFMNAEHRRVKEKHQVLASTGCSKDFCQAGRMVHTDEPRVGENRSLTEVCEEATAFLRDLFEGGYFVDRAAFDARVKDVLGEINHGASNGIASVDKVQKLLGGTWTQTYEELEFGIRRSWRNSRKCIARNHHQELKLCDLRSVTTSVEMAEQLLRNAILAFNDGRVEPTVFVFPPRKINSRGPMIWNSQILGFAGYQISDNIILGDPASVELTKAIMELGWTPPEPRSQWDLLPLVVMAEGDKPVIMEIPSPLSRLVSIDHPKYPAIGELGLKWVAAPALTRLGFDIGGVQYTAAPFIGWFMDAEIGVRNLADTFRYNVLPDVIKAMGLTDDKFEDGLEDFEDLPEYEQLKMLSLAQSELTYATQYSYNKAGVTMSDSLSASKKWCKFDDEFKDKHGYRLPADPYWIAPPQGSIIPVWHRGGAPNYQPKPMISKHVQDPIKAWRRESPENGLKSEIAKIMTLQQNPASSPKLYGQNSEMADDEADEFEDLGMSFSSSSVSNLSISRPSSSQVSSSRSLTSRSSMSTFNETKTIAIYFCSAGTVAEKLATRLHKVVNSVKTEMNVALHPRVQSLDHLAPEDITPNKVLLIFVSSVGKGEVPANGSAFLRLKAQPSYQGANFAIFGNGDSRYSATYNGAAKIINDHMLGLGGYSICGKVFRGDTALEPIPFKAMKKWWNELQSRIEGIQNGHRMENSSVLDPDAEDSSLETLSEEVTGQLVDCVGDLDTLKPAAIVSTTLETSSKPSQNSMLLTLDIDNEEFDDMNCIQILPLNHPSKVDRALAALDVSGNDTFNITEQDCATNAEYLSKCADLERPFKSIDWLCKTDDKAGSMMQNMLGCLSALESLEILRKSHLLSEVNHSDILRSMDLLHLRTYSVASTPKPHQDSALVSSTPADNTVSIMLKRLPCGRFSDTFLDDHAEEEKPLVNYRFVDSVAGPAARALIPDIDAPLILVATGAGFGPIRNLIEARIATAQKQKGTWAGGRISVFLGLHPTDVPLVEPTLQDATEMGLAETVEIVESNADHRRVQDVLSESAETLKETVEEHGGHVFVCTNGQAAEDIKNVFTSVMPEAFESGKNPDWYLEETF